MRFVITVEDIISIGLIVIIGLSFLVLIIKWWIIGLFNRFKKRRENNAERGSQEG